MAETKKNVKKVAEKKPVKKNETKPEKKETKKLEVEEEEETGFEGIKSKNDRTPRDGKSTFNRIMNAVLWVIVLAWMAICVTDYILTSKEKDPIFCLSEKTHEYKDGKTYECVGLGYKYYRYDRSEVHLAEQFGGIWIKEAQPEETK